MYAARQERPTPYVDKTVYAGWNAMCVSAYLAAAEVLDLKDARAFALRSLDRLLSEGWIAGRSISTALLTSAPTSNSAGEDTPSALAPAPTLRHVIAYSDPKAERRETAGVLDDYAFTVIACLDAYEATADMSYFRFARAIADAMIAGFYDANEGGFFDTHAARVETGLTSSPAAIGILGTPRKPFQDSPTPAGNPAAAIALLRLHGYTNESSYREKAEATLELYSGAAAQHGIFAATYGLAVARFTSPHTQVVVIGSDETARTLYKAARSPLSLEMAVLHLDRDKAVAQNLPPALAETIPHLPALRGEGIVRGGLLKLRLPASRIFRGRFGPHTRRANAASSITPPRTRIASLPLRLWATCECLHTRTSICSDGPVFLPTSEVDRLPRR